ncbi:myelin regulatory factor-like protein isoform 9-T12 [Syngnathus typhle]
MEAAAVHGETEALQQFFRGHDVRQVLDNSVAVDTSILEQYLSSDFNAFPLPESPPNSDVCSPERITDFQTEISYWSERPLLRPTAYRSQFGRSDGGSVAPSPSDSYVGGGMPSGSPASLLTSALPLLNCFPDRSKRKQSESQDSSAGPDRLALGDEGTQGGPVLGGRLSWESFCPAEWSAVLDANLHVMPPPALAVATDKGFNFSPTDEAFVCQKKNHFQVTVHVGVAREPAYVRTPRGVRHLHYFEIDVFGVKMESPEHRVSMEQSRADRTKKPLGPVRVSVAAGVVGKVTLGRLHFSETTANNMRKKGRPNPDQRYFRMVVGLYGAVKEEDQDEEPSSFLLAALLSERLIVRASNPGQFEMDGDALWQRGAEHDAVTCHGRVGINTDAPDEALVVCGNATVMGRVMQPSDGRAKSNIREVDGEEQLRRITRMRLVEFDYKPEFASKMGIKHTHQTGVLAQEVKELLPSAVKEVGDITCHGGHRIDNFLMVDKVYCTIWGLVYVGGKRRSGRGGRAERTVGRLAGAPPRAGSRSLLLLLCHPGSDLHGERGRGAAAFQDGRQPGDPRERVGGLEAAPRQAQEPDGKSALQRNVKEAQHRVGGNGAEFPRGSQSLRGGRLRVAENVSRRSVHTVPRRRRLHHHHRHRVPAQLDARQRWAAFQRQRRPSAPRGRGPPTCTSAICCTATPCTAAPRQREAPTRGRPATERVSGRRGPMTPLRGTPSDKRKATTSFCRSFKALRTGQTPPSSPS